MRTLTVVTLLLALVATSATSAGKPVGIVKTYKPDATILRDGAELPVSQGLGVYPGDTIITRSPGAVGISFVDGAVLSLGPATEFAIEGFKFEPAKKNLSFLSRIERGTASFVSGAIGRMSPESVKFKTPTAVLGLRGTKMLIKVQ